MSATQPQARPLPTTSPPGAVHRPGHAAVLHVYLAGTVLVSTCSSLSTFRV
ncbi:hypothetical protein ACQPZF_36065 [Actinosynnema sp. CS-041913]|uniref:hypothetical protein n=1 Tax=Actinosynnema sp. CS-041913 TaxID=3239917 RepID=UPI003D8AE9D3